MVGLESESLDDLGRGNKLRCKSRVESRNRAKTAGDVDSEPGQRHRRDQR